MSALPIAQLEARGEVLDLKCGQPFPIRGVARIWLVLEGKLDLFLVEMRDGEPVGARHHLMRVEAGNPVFGFDVPRHSPFAVIASPSTGSRILCLPPDELRAADANGVRVAGSVIDLWVENLGSAISGNTGPKSFLELTPGETITAGDAPTVLLPMSGVVWISNIEGELLVLGDNQISPLDPGSFFPVSRAVWLACDPRARVKCLDTAGWLQADPAWSGLAGFQNRLFAWLLKDRSRVERKERERLAAGAQADTAVLVGSLRRLASPLEPPEEHLDGKPGDLDSLLQVCRVVASTAGFDLPAVTGRIQLPKRMAPVIGLAEALRIRTRKVILKGKWWTGEGGALVGFRARDKGPVGLLPGPQGYRLYDPASRRRTPITEDVASGLDPFAYVLYRPFPRKALAFRDLLLFGLQEGRTDTAVIVLMGIAVALMSVVTPVVTGIIFDTVVPGADRRSLAALSLLLVIAAVTAVSFTVTRGLAVLRLQSRMETSIQAAVWDRLLALPVPFFRRYTAGDLARRSLGISQIREALTGSALSGILTGIFSITSCLLMFYFNWRLALIATALVIASFAIVTLFGWLEVGILRMASELGGRLAGMALQFINGVSRLRVTGTEDRAFAVWARGFADERVLAIKAQKVVYCVAVFQAGFPVLASAVVLGCAASFMKASDRDRLTTGEFLAFMAAFAQFSTAALELSSTLIALLNVVPLYERAKPVLRCLPEVAPRQAAPPELTGSISVHHVSFRYRENGPWVLRDFSYNISAGEFVAFVGPSGSGKSTLFRLLLGFETPGAGAVYYDGQNLAGLDVQAVRRQIGTVLQNARLTTGSILQNIVGEGSFTLDDAWEAARLAGLEEDLRMMPMGVYTMISEGGGGLSGGQRQRLLIARAILNKPRIFCFDEATSALDNRTQAIVSQSLRTLNATRVVIAHRLSTVTHADRICVLDKGAMVQSGTYDELIQQKGLFAELAKRQLA